MQELGLLKIFVFMIRQKIFRNAVSNDFVLHLIKNIEELQELIDNEQYDDGYLKYFEEFDKMQLKAVALYKELEGQSELNNPRFVRKYGKITQVMNTTKFFNSIIHWVGEDQ